MKKLTILFLFFMIPIFAQQETPATSGDTLTVTENVYDCVNEVYNSTPGIKLLMQRLLSDKEYLRQVHREIMNDPQLRTELQNFIRSNKGMMHEDQLNRNDQQMENNKNGEIEADPQNQDDEQSNVDETDDQL